MHILAALFFRPSWHQWNFLLHDGTVFTDLVYSKISFCKLSSEIISTTGSPSSKYEHRRASALLRNIQNIRICMGKKTIVSVTYKNERISIKKQLTLLKMCATSLLCGPRVDLWPFYGFLCKRFSLYIKVYQDARRRSFFELGLPVVVPF